MTYASKRPFKMWAYTVSHGFLLLRSPMLFEDLEGYSEETNFNIDIEFTSVFYLDIPNHLNGISISEITDEIPDKIPNKIKPYASSSGTKIFEIKSDGVCFYVIAGGFMVGKNYWVSEDKILNMDLEYDEVLAIG
jgi:hypothetical protein